MSKQIILPVSFNEAIHLLRMLDKAPIDIKDIYPCSPIRKDPVFKDHLEVELGYTLADDLRKLIEKQVNRYLDGQDGEIK